MWQAQALGQHDSDTWSTKVQWVIIIGALTFMNHRTTPYYIPVRNLENNTSSYCTCKLSSVYACGYVPLWRTPLMLFFVMWGTLVTKPPSWWVSIDLSLIVKSEWWALKFTPRLGLLVWAARYVWSWLHFYHQHHAKNYSVNHQPESTIINNH